MKKNACCCLLMLFFSMNSLASPAVNRYLGNAQMNTLDQREEVRVDAGWIDQPELRYDANDQQETGIAFRFRPRFGSQRQAENRIAELLNQQYFAARGNQLNSKLKQRYLKLIELIESYNEHRYFSQKIEYSQQQLEIARSRARTENFSVADLQSAEFELHRNKQQSSLHQQRLARDLNGFAELSPQQARDFLATWAQQVSDWDDIAASREVLQQTTDYPLMAQVDLQLAQQKLRLARSESASWLKFVELKYVDRPTGDNETSLGLSIPLGSERFGISQRAAEVNREYMDLLGQQQELSRALSDSTQELEWLQGQALLVASSLSLLQRQYTKLGNVAEPALLLKLKSGILQHENELRRLHIRGLRGHIELLHRSGYLARPPLVNWLLGSRPGLRE